MHHYIHSIHHKTLKIKQIPAEGKRTQYTQNSKTQTADHSVIYLIKITFTS